MTQLQVLEVKSYIFFPEGLVTNLIYVYEKYYFQYKNSPLRPKLQNVLLRISYEKISKMFTTYVSWMGEQTLQYDVKKIACSFGKWVKAQVIFYRSKTYCL